MRQLCGVVVLVAVAGCLGARSVPCGDGWCAPDTVCAEALNLCVQPAQVGACVDVPDGDPCTTNTIAMGTCNDGVCIKSGCGNGVVDTGEACDDGNTISGDGCSADCLSTEVCGNGIIDLAEGEQCDCGTTNAVNPACSGPNSNTSGTCSLQCKNRCGDGVLEADELCDPSAPSSPPPLCAGAVYDRGLTTCSITCQPVIAAGPCKFIGWRTRITQPSPPITDIAVTTSIDHGFYVTGPNIGLGTNYVGTVEHISTLGTLTRIWALDDNTAVAVGVGGTISQFDGTTWTDSTVGNADFVDVWGRSVAGQLEIYALTATAVYRADGTGPSATWSPVAQMPPGMFHAIGGDDTHIYVAGDHGTLLIYDGATWQTADVGTSENLRGVWWAGGLLVAVGDNGTIVQNDGTGWVPGRVPIDTPDLLAVWGDGIPDGTSTTQGFFAVGERGSVLYYDGRVWRPMDLGRGVTGSHDQTLFAVTGLKGAGVGVGGTTDIITYEGAAWSPSEQPSDQNIYAIWGDAPDDVFAVGAFGTILHHDGLSWVPQSSPTTNDLHAVWGAGPNDVYAVGDAGTLLHYDGVMWATGVSGSTNNLTSVFESPSGEVFVGDAVGVYRYTGTLVEQFPAVVKAMCGTTSPSELWAGGGGAYRYDGLADTYFAQPMTLVALTCTATDVFTMGTGSGATSWHYDGTGWTLLPFTATDRDAIAAFSNTNLFAVGSNGSLSQWNGTAIEPFVSRTPLDLTAIFVTKNIVFMAGADGTLDVMVFHQ